MYNDKSINIENLIIHINKNIYFKNVHYFIRCVNNIVIVKKIEMIRQNFWTYLRDIALI